MERMDGISYPGCAHDGPETPFRLLDREDIRLRVHVVHQNGLAGCDMRYLAPESRSHRDDDEETTHCCNVPSARAYVLTNGPVVGLAVFGEEESEHDLEQGNLSVLLDAVFVEREDDLGLAAEAAVRASGL